MRVREYMRSGQRDILVGHHVTTGFGYVFPHWREGFRFPGLVEDAWNALDHAMLGCVPSGIVAEDGDVKVGDICGRIDGEIVGDRGEDEDGAKEDEGEEDEGDVECAPLGHGGGRATRKCKLCTKIINN